MYNTTYRFAEAARYFVELQSIDYRKSFSCSHDMKHVQVDGVTVGFRKAGCVVYRPWGYDANAEAVLGNTFHDRLYVTKPHDRAILLRLVRDGKTPSGLTQEDWETWLHLKESQLAQANERQALFPEIVRMKALVTIMKECTSDEDGKMRAPTGSAELLRTMGCPTPASVACRPGAWKAVRLLGDGEVVRECILSSIRPFSKGVAEFVTPFVGTTLPDARRRLLDG